MGILDPYKEKYEEIKDKASKSMVNLESSVSESFKNSVQKGKKAGCQFMQRQN